MVRKYHNHKPQTTPWHCFVFCTTVPFFPQRNKNGTVCFCITVPCLSTIVPFFALLFRFLPQRNKNVTVCFCTTAVFALLFRFFFTTEQKNGTVCFCITVPCFRTTDPFFLHYLFRFFTEQCVFVTLFRFCTSVLCFPQQNKKRKSVFSYHCSVFSYHCSVFCTTVLFFPQQNSVFLYHCSVFALLFLSFHNGTKNGTVCF